MHDLVTGTAFAPLAVVNGGADPIVNLDTLDQSRLIQNSAVPIDTLQRFTHIHPMHSENNDVALRRLLLRPGDCSRTKIGDKLGQCRRASGIGYNHGVTGVYQVTAERACYIPGS
jgi:hypothetical protein